MRMKILGISLSTRAAVVVAVTLIVCSGTLFVANIATSGVRLQSSTRFFNTPVSIMLMTPDSLPIDETQFWATATAIIFNAVPASRNQLGAAQTAVANANNAFATAQASQSALPPISPAVGELSDDSPSDPPPR